MSTFKKFNPEKPEETGPPLRFGVPGEVRQSREVVVTDGDVRLQTAVLELGVEGESCWLQPETEEPLVFEVAGWHPLPTPDDGMVMVPEELGGDDLEAVNDCINAWVFGHRKEPVPALWAEIVNRLKEANQ